MGYEGVTPEALEALQPFADTHQDSVLFVNRPYGPKYLGAYSERWGKLTYAIWEVDGHVLAPVEHTADDEDDYISPLTDEDFEALGLKPVEKGVEYGSEDGGFDLDGWDGPFGTLEPEFPSMDYVHVDAYKRGVLNRHDLTVEELDRSVEVLRAFEALRRLGG